MIKRHTFPPVIGPDSTVLILGSLPSVRSVAEGFYYMHPQNRFWRVLSAVYSYDFYHASIEERKKNLLSRGIALYDVIEECEIDSSRDSSIQQAKIQNIRALLKASRISRIILNGRTAYALFLRAYPELADMACYAPSTSSANAAYSLNRLIEAWKELLPLK